MASQSLPKQSVTVPISIPQIDELHNIHGGLESVLWMCYLAIGGDTDDANKTARSVHSMLEPWHERLSDFLEEFEADFAELRREMRERKAQEDRSREQEEDRGNAEECLPLGSTNTLSRG